MLLKRAVVLLAIATLLSGSELHARSVRSYFPTPIREMAAFADVIVSGEIVRLDLPDVLLRVDQRIAGTLPPTVGDGFLRIRGFEDWRCAVRFTDYAVGQRAIFFLVESEDKSGELRLEIMGGGGGGEMPLSGPRGGRTRVLARNTSHLPTNLFELGGAFDTGPDRIGFVAYAVDHEVFVRAIQSYRKSVRFTVNPEFGYPERESIRWVIGDAALREFRGSSAFARSLMDEEEQRWRQDTDYSIFDSVDRKKLPADRVPLDTSGVQAFFVVADAMLADRDPSPTEWKALFESPGYATLVEQRAADRVLREILPVALRPSMRSGPSSMGEPSGAFELVSYFQEAVLNRDRLMSAANSLRRQPLKGAACQRASAWFASDPEIQNDLNLFAVIFPGDGHTRDRVVFDLTYVTNDIDGYRSVAVREGSRSLYLAQDEAARVAFLALRDGLRPTHGGQGAGAEQELVSILGGLQGQGIALMVGVCDPLENEGPDTAAVRLRSFERSRFREVMGYADQMLSLLDAQLARYAKEPREVDACVVALQPQFAALLPPVGYHMASVIAWAFGEPRLAAHSIDPYQFFSDYQEAARHLDVGFHFFSDDAMAAIERLRRLEQD